LNNFHFSSIPPKTYVFDHVVSSSTNAAGQKKQEENVLGTCLSSVTTPTNKKKDVCVLSMGETDGRKPLNGSNIHSPRPSSTTPFLKALVSFFSDFTNEGEKEEEEISVSVCELMGDVFRDVLQTNDNDEHVLQYDHPATAGTGGTSGGEKGMPRVWLTNLISVRVKSSSDFQRVMNIVHSRRARINMNDGSTEYINQHSTTDDSTKTRIAGLPIHPASHLIITVDVATTTTTTNNNTTNDNNDRTLTAVSLGSGLHPSSFEMEHHNSSDNDSNNNNNNKKNTLFAPSEASAESLHQVLLLCQQSLSSLNYVLLSIAANEKQVQVTLLLVVVVVVVDAWYSSLVSLLPLSFLLLLFFYTLSNKPTNQQQ
jgi:hypothetical protein